MGNASLKEGLISYFVAFVIILAINFVLPRLMPGNPIQAIYGKEALAAMTPEMESHLVQLFSLDKSISDQLIAYLLGLLRGDLGFSYYYRDQVLSVIMGALPWTILLTSLSLIIATFLGIVLGIESGYRRGTSFDRSATVVSMLLAGFPDFFIGIVLLLAFAAGLNIFPISGAVTPYSGYRGTDYVFDVLNHLALPLSSLVLVQLSQIYLLTRNTIVSLKGESFILTSLAKGCTDYSIKYNHLGRNSLVPVLTSTSLRIPHLLTGALFIEIVFSYPGIGSLLSTAIDTRDYPLIQGILLMVSISVLTVNLIVDVLYKKLDPRVKNAH